MGDAAEPRGPEQLAAALRRFWFSDEVVLYVGLTADSLRRRITAYYKTALGAAGPHAGGYRCAARGRARRW